MTTDNTPAAAPARVRRPVTRRDFVLGRISVLCLAGAMILGWFARFQLGITFNSVSFFSTAAVGAFCGVLCVLRTEYRSPSAWLACVFNLFLVAHWILQGSYGKPSASLVTVVRCHVFRRLFTLASALSLVLCIAMLVLWTLSSKWDRWLVLPSTASGRMWVVGSDHRGLRVITVSEWPNRESWRFYSAEADRPIANEIFAAATPPVGWEPVTIRYFYQFPIWIEFDDTNVTARRYPTGVEFVRGPASTQADDTDGEGSGSARVGTATAINVPHWLIALAMAAIGLPWLVQLTGRVLLVRHRRRRGRCGSCGYNLAATPGRCPECGTAVSSEG